MRFDLVQKPAFLADFMMVPESVKKRVVRAIERIEHDPFGADGKVKKIAKHRYRNVYRYRLGDYRLVYAVGTGVISILAIGPRSEVYERLAFEADQAVMTTGDLASAAPKVFVTTSFDGQRTEYPEARAEQGDASAPLEAPPLRNQLMLDLLRLWSIDERFHEAICRCRTIDDLIDLDIPDSVKERLLYVVEPATAEEIEEQPNLELPEPTDLERYAAGALKQFLLKLDPDQELVARRALRGPTLVKGGPGTGKSLVALYRIRNLLTPAVQESLFGHDRPRVLFVTYTTSLISACQQLLTDLLDGNLTGVDVTNLDKLVKSIIEASGEHFAPASSEKKTWALLRAIEHLKARGESQITSVIESLRPDYLIEEFDWVIEGRALGSLDEYLAEDRTGRGVRLDARARAAVWQLHAAYAELMVNAKSATWDVYRSRAAQLLAEGKVDFPRYDAVFIDEAQDLTPAGITVCVQLCRNRQGLFLTADASQSIYNRGFAWRRVDDALAFRGRTVVLRRNYRTTRQIADAAVQLLADHGGGDAESLLSEPVHSGAKPTLLLCRNLEGQVAATAEFIRASARDLRLPLASGAVLLPSNKAAERFAEDLKAQGVPAKFVRGSALNLDENVVKVMTLHSAKGLEFPFVVVARLDENLFPRLPPDASEEERQVALEEQRRLLFVGMTRAMRRLAISCIARHPSLYIAELDPALWNRVEWTHVPSRAS